MNRLSAAKGVCLVASLSLADATATTAAAEPVRVMSLNVCTDQLAMLLAKPGQLISVSTLADDPHLSFHRRLAGDLPRNRGLAEEVIAATPDLVVTGQFSLHDTTQVLHRLGYRVEEFSYVQSLESVPTEIRRMGALLGAGKKAEELVAAMQAELAGVPKQHCSRPVRALAYEQNGIALGTGTLMDSAMQSAGLVNVAAEQGFAGMTPFPLELLVKDAPDILVIPDIMADTPTLADQIADHPAIGAMSRNILKVRVPAGSLACGGPFVVEAVKALAAARSKALPCQGSAPQ
jgi:iron complex transport system substrate-binding protein